MENLKALLNFDVSDDLQQLFKFKYEYYVNNLPYESQQDTRMCIHILL